MFWGWAAPGGWADSYHDRNNDRPSCQAYGLPPLASLPGGAGGRNYSCAKRFSCPSSILLKHLNEYGPRRRCAMCRALHEPLREAPTCGPQQGGDHRRNCSRSGGRREGKPRRCGWNEGATWRVIHRQQADLNGCSDLISLNLNFLEMLLGLHGVSRSRPGSHAIQGLPPRRSDWDHWRS